MHTELFIRRKAHIVVAVQVFELGQHHITEALGRTVEVARHVVWVFFSQRFEHRALAATHVSLHENSSAGEAADFNQVCRLL